MSSYRLLRELGSRAQHSYAAMRESDLVVIQRFTKATGTGASGITTSAARATNLDAESMALLLRDARSLAKSWHPNIARVKHVDLASGELTLASEMIEGATLQDLVAAAAIEGEPAGETTALPLPIALRIVSDVLAGLHALHALKDGMNAPLDAIHGEICPANVVVGRDGVARIVNVLRSRPVRVGADSEAIGYAAPEALEAGGTEDPRADVYSAGVLLWEALAGERLWNEVSVERVLARQREEELPHPIPALDRENPFQRVIDVALRALAFDPGARYGSIAEMMADMRRSAGTRLASSAAVAVLLSDLVGDSIRVRRAELDPQQSGARQRAAATSGIVMRAADHASAETAPLPPLPPPAPLPTPIALSPLSPLSPISPILPVLPTPAQPIITQVTVPTPARSIAPTPIAPSAVDTFVIEREAPPKRRVLFAACLGIAVALALVITIFVVRGLRASSLDRDTRSPAAEATPVPMPSLGAPPASTTVVPSSEAMEAVTPPTGTTATPPPVRVKAPPSPAPSATAKKKSVYEP